MERNERVEMKRLFNILRTKKILIAFILISFMFMGYMYSYKYAVPKYKSTSTLLLIPNDKSEAKAVTNSDLTLNSGLISTYSNIAKQSRVLKQVINNLGLNMTEEELLSKIEVNVKTDTYIIEISSVDINPEKAMLITDELANVFLEEIKNIYNLNNIGIVDKAETASEPYNVNHKKDMLMFFAIGIVASGMSIIAIYIFDNTIKTEEDIEEYVKIKTLGRIPLNANKKNEIVNKNDAKSYITECINTIRTNILYMSSIKGAKTILITSCTAEEGKSWVSANVAASFAQTNKKVLLIDADMRKGRTNKIFNLSNKEGLSNYLYNMTGNIKKDMQIARNYIKESNIPNLHIITNGTIPPNPSELLDSDSMKELIFILKNMYDVVIVDAPPCMLVTDSAILSTIIDSTILVACSEKTKIKDLEEVKKSIQIVGGKIIGAILNKVKVSKKTYSKSYYYGNSKQEQKVETKQKEAISVNEIVDIAIEKLEEKQYYSMFATQNNVTENDEKQIENKVVLEDYKQTEYFKEIIGSISDLKEKLLDNQIENKLKWRKDEEQIRNFICEKLDELQQKNKDELQSVNYVEDLIKISNELETIKENVENIDYIKDLQVISDEIDIIKQRFEELDNTNKIDKISLELDNIKDSITDINYIEEVNTISSKIDSMKEYFTNIDNSNEINTIIDELRQMKQHFNDNTKNIAIQNLQNEIKEVKQVHKQLMEYTKYTMYIKSVIDNMSKERLDKEQIQNIIKEEISNINYNKQFENINEMLINLKDNYLELSNKIELNNYEEEQIDRENIIDIKALKKQKRSNSKKKEFLLQEDISYEDLEKTAFCVIPFPKNNSQEEEYNSITAVK